MTMLVMCGDQVSPTMLTIITDTPAALVSSLCTGRKLLALLSRDQREGLRYRGWPRLLSLHVITPGLTPLTDVVEFLRILTELEWAELKILQRESFNDLNTFPNYYLMCINMRPEKGMK